MRIRSFIAAIVVLTGLSLVPASAADSLLTTNADPAECTTLETGTQTFTLTVEYDLGNNQPDYLSVAVSEDGYGSVDKEVDLSGRSSQGTVTFEVTDTVESGWEQATVQYDIWSQSDDFTAAASDRTRYAVLGSDSSCEGNPETVTVDLTDSDGNVPSGSVYATLSDQGTGDSSTTAAENGLAKFTDNEFVEPGTYYLEVVQNDPYEYWGHTEISVDDGESAFESFERGGVYLTGTRVDGGDGASVGVGESISVTLDAARPRNGEEVMVETYVYPTGETRPEIPDETYTHGKVSSGLNDIEYAIEAPQSSGEYQVDFVVKTSFSRSDISDYLTTDVVTGPTITVETFEPPSIGSSEPTEEVVNVGPDERQTFSVSVSDPDSTPTVQWYVDGSRIDTGSRYEFTASEFGAGQHTVRAEVSDGSSRTSDTRREWTVDIAEAPEITSVSPGNTEVFLGETVTFDADTDSTGLDYQWSVGDRTFEGSSVETTFDSAGAETVEVAVTNDRGVTTRQSFVVTVENAPPSVTDLAVAPSSVTVGEQITLEAAATDPEGRETSFDYQWTVDGQTLEGSSVETTVTETGSYDVELVVENDFGTSTTQTRTLTVEAAPPSITEMNVAPSSVTAGEQISLSATAADPADRGTGFTYAWSVGDERLSGRTAEMRLTEVGTHEVELVVENEYGTTTTRSQSVTVSNDEPTLERRSPEARPTPRAGTEQRFVVDVADADAEPATVRWSVNGQQVASQPVTADERRLSVSHRFTDPGTHTVEVTVEDGHGARSTRDWTVAVQNRPPRIETVGPASATISQMSGTTRTFNAAATDPDGGSVAYRWLVDGSQQSTGPRYTHTFDEVGTHNVTVVATDSDGGVATHSWSAAVRNFRRVPEIDSSATVTALEPGNETRFIALSFRNPSVNNRTANVELALSLPSGVTVSATRNIRVGSQPEYVGEATVDPSQQTSISLAITAEDESLAGQRIDVPYQVIYYPAGQRDSYRVVENATTTIQVVGDETATAGSVDQSGTSGSAGDGEDATGSAGDDADPASGSGPGFTVGTVLLALPLWLLARRR